MTWEVIHGEALAVLRGMEAESVNAVVTDPPYPCVKRDYGTMTEAEWFALMKPLVMECRRVLVPRGSAVFILQPNSERVGQMRTWLWEFMAWAGREWNQVQDAWWWNPASPPTVHAHRARGLMRPSVKACVWLGSPDCYRDQDGVLWAESESQKAEDRNDRALRRFPSGLTTRRARIAAAVDERGGATPFNLLPFANTDSSASSGADGHGAGTPHALAAWWVRYICPPAGTVLDPFAGAGSIGIAAHAEGRSYIGIEQRADYCDIARHRIRDEAPLFAEVSA